MKLKIYNFEIEEDRNSFILTEYWEIEETINWKKTWNIRVWVKDQTYPSTLARCFEKIQHSLKKNKNIVLEIEEYKKEIEKINNDFIQEIKNITNNLWAKD